MANVTINGTTNADVLIGDTTSLDNDKIYGFGNNDHLLGGLGTNTLDGGLGIDTLDMSQVSPYGGPVLKGVVNLTTGVASETYAVGTGTDTLVSIENVIGSGGNDVVNGNSVANKLEGRDGDDALRGGAGNDTLLGGDGNDLLRGGKDSDELDGGQGDDTYQWFAGEGKDNYNDTGTGGQDVIVGDLTSFTGLQNTFSAANGIEEIRDVASITVTGGPANWNFAGVDTHGVDLNGMNQASNILALGDHITGTDQYGETIRGYNGADLLNGGNGNDVLWGGNMDDVLIGGDGHNTETWDFDLNAFVHSDDGDDTLLGGCGNDSLDGGSGNDLLVGGSQNDFLNGGVGDDVLIGDKDPTHVDASDNGNGIGNDTLRGGDGNDNLTGGKGIDDLDGQQGDDTYHWAAGDGKDVYNDTGTGGHDTIVGDGSSFTGLQNVFSAANGIEEITQVSDITVSGGPAAWNFIGVDTHGVTLNGTAQGAIGPGDVITGTDQYGEVIKGMNGNDMLNGANGNDTLSGGNMDDVLIGGDGHNTETWDFDLNAFVHSDDGNDLLLGGCGNDSLDGGSGNDTLVGGSQNDVLSGGLGNDLLIGDKDAGFFDPGYYPSGQDTGNGVGNDILSGGDGNDTLRGGAGNDLLNGDAGDDSVVGGTGKDTMTGSAGDDTFVVAESDTAINVAGADLIEDFQGAGLVNGPGVDKDHLTFDVDLAMGPGYANMVGTTLIGANTYAVIDFGEGSGPDHFINVKFSGFTNDAAGQAAGGAAFVADAAAYNFV